MRTSRCQAAADGQGLAGTGDACRGGPAAAIGVCGRASEARAIGQGWLSETTQRALEGKLIGRGRCFSIAESSTDQPERCGLRVEAIGRQGAAEGGRGEGLSCQKGQRSIRRLMP